MNKDELRKIYLAKRLALTENEHHALSLKIADLFFQSVDLSSIQILHIYLPLQSKREPNTWLIIDRIQKEFSHIRLVIPKVIGEEMEHIFFEGPDQLEKSTWGMVEPRFGVFAEPQNIDIVIVPLLAVDRQGHRLGYGKGFYDRFLNTCRQDCLKIGLSFFKPEHKIKDIDNYDVPLTRCITPAEVYQFHNQ